MGGSKGKGKGVSGGGKNRKEPQNERSKIDGKNKGDGKGNHAFVKPSDVHFSQESIAQKFRDGRDVNSTIERLKDKSMQKREIPVIQVFRRSDGELQTHDNRRLHAFQETEKSGGCRKIKVEITEKPIPASKLTTRNDGTSVRMRGTRIDSASGDASVANKGTGKGKSKNCAEAERNVSCPVCGARRFKSPAGAVQHVESGACLACKGKENAKQQIFNFVNRHEQTAPFLNRMLTHGSMGPSGYVAGSHLYKCPTCGKTFELMSALMQHQSDRHQSVTRLALTV